MLNLADYSGETIRIDREGTWFYGRNKIDRSGLVRLFYQYLFYRDGVHQIITPAERVPVSVDDTPYFVNNIIERNANCLAFLLNDGTELELDQAHVPYTDAGGILMVAVRNGLIARFRQSCHIELGLRLGSSDDGRLFLDNCGERFYIQSLA